MRIFCLINAVLEISVGIMLLFLPTLVPDVADLDAQGLTFARMYGGAALAVGLLAYQAWKNADTYAVTSLVLTGLTVFHIGVTIAAYLGFSAGAATFLPIAILHGALAGLSLFFVFKNN